MGVRRGRRGGPNATVPAGLGRTVFDMREERGLSQRALGTLVGADQSFISHVETGRIDQPSFDYLRRLAAALEVPLLAFLVEAEFLRPDEAVGLDNADLARVVVAMRESPAFMAQVCRLGDDDGRVLARLVAGLAAQLGAILDDRESRPPG